MRRDIFTPDHEAFRGLVRDFVANEVVPYYADWEEAGRLPRELFEQLGSLGLLGMSIENLVCRHWPILKDSDLQYTVQSLIEYWKIDKNLALSVVHDQRKFDKVNEWNNSVKTGKIRSNLDTIVLGKILKSRQ